jgi:MFS superfamily sulfate permease-like transporter
MKVLGNTDAYGGLAALKKHGAKDAFAGFLVSLIALPLCLGIAKASGFPPMGGLITAIVGGLVVGWLSGSPLTIKGPAAGLIAIAIGCVDSFANPADPMAGYRATLAVIVAASVIQIAFAVLKTGKLGEFFPSSAVHGMLAAIGIIIISKQIPVLLGVTPTAKEPLQLLAEIPSILTSANPEIACIGFVSLAILILLPLIKNKYVKILPAPMVVLLVAIPFGHYFDLEHEHSYLFGAKTNYTLGPKFLVTLPSNVIDGIVFPDWSQIFTLTALKYIVLFAMVGSLESLLTVKAIDIVDPAKRSSNLNKDLLAIGVGNAISGLLGGLPMISEVVRSSANVNSGAKSGWANTAHGLFMLIFLLFLTSLIHQIPLAALAAMLVFTGYRLGGPLHWRNAWAIGWEQFVIFTVTVVVTLATDLLVGIFAGIVIHIILNLAHGASLKTVFKPDITFEEEGESIVVYFHDSVVFSNWLSIAKQLDSIAVDRSLILNLSQLKFADHSVLKNLGQFEQARMAIGQHVELRGLDMLLPLSAHPMATRKSKGTTPAEITK